MHALLVRWTSAFRTANIHFTRSKSYLPAILIFGSVFYSCKKNSSNNESLIRHPDKRHQSA